MYKLLSLQVDLYNLTKNPFISFAQCHFTKLVIMPHWAFQQLGEEVGDPKYEEVPFSDLL